jgi:DNA-binding transcriptional regulator YiaG
MAKPFKDRRVLLSQIDQNTFVESIKLKLACTNSELANIFGISQRQLYDWKAGRSTMPLNIFLKHI